MFLSVGVWGIWAGVFLLELVGLGDASSHWMDSSASWLTDNLCRFLGTSLPGKCRRGQEWDMAGALRGPRSL